MVFGKKSIETAQLADMGKFYTGDVVRNGSGCGGDAQYVPGRHEQELGFRIDEARDQPGTGDAVDLRAFTRDPFHSRLPFARAMFVRPALRARRRRRRRSPE